MSTIQKIKTDVLVIGSGAAGMTAAICAAKSGLKALLIEKAKTLGGTTAISGGMPWVPANHLLAEAGTPDTKEAAFEYLRNTLGNRMRTDMIEAYLDAAPDMLRFLTDNTEVEFRIRPHMPDYASEVSGAALARCLEPVPYDGRRLGDHFKLLRPPRVETMVFGGMMVNAADVGHLLKARRSLNSFLHSARLILSYGLDRIRYQRGARLVAGNALAARLLKSALDCGIEIRIGTAARSLLREDDRVVGALADCDGAAIRVEARKGVVVATGGFPQNAEMRARYIPYADQHRSMAPADNVGDGLKLALNVGAVLDGENQGGAFLTPVSVMHTAHGQTLTFPHLITDRAKPGAIAVNRHARRFVNEADSYHDFVEAMRQDEGAGIPSFLVCDRRFIDKYGLGMVRPAPFPRGRFIKAGYLHEADTPEGLAKKLGLDGATLRETVDRYNVDARGGVDRQFGKGSTGYNRHMGDADHKPNPCVAPLDSAPYYAVKLFTGDIGTALGIRVNAHAQALDEHDSPIQGLYICGNDMNSVMAGTYATGGITIGPAMTFGYIAARHMAGQAHRDKVNQQADVATAAGGIRQSG